MMRIKWLQTNLGDLRIEDLLALLNKHKYSNSLSKGFIVDEYREDHIMARHVSRIDIESVIINPLGEELVQKVTQYETVSFRISSNRPGIEITNPPKSTTKFMNQLALATEFGISIEPLTFDLKNFTSALLSNTKDSYVSSIEYSNILYDDQIIGKVVLTGKGDIEGLAQTIIRDKKHVLSRVKIKLPDITLTLSEKGSIQFSRQPSDSLLSNVRHLIHRK